MGIYDRDYGRNDYDGSQPGFHLGGVRSLTTNIVLFTAAVYLLQLFTQADSANYGWVTNWFSLYGNSLTDPRLWCGFLTYGFLHSPIDLGHILFNMLGLWFLGRRIEEHYGPREFLTFYSVSIVFAGVCWYFAEFAYHKAQFPQIRMLGASGGVSAILVLFALNFPHQRLMIWGAFGLPAWVLASFLVVQDIFGAINRFDNIAFTAHLGGALFAYLYFRRQWKLSNWIPRSFSFKLPRSKPKLRVHDPDEPSSDMDRKLDAILKKIKEQGQDSLTSSERRFLEKASRKYQRKHQ